MDEKTAQSAVSVGSSFNLDDGGPSLTPSSTGNSRMSAKEARALRGTANFDLDGKDHDWQDRGLRLGFAIKQQLWYQVLFALLAVGLPTLLINELVHPRNRFFIVGDPTISYPGPNKDTVPMWFIVPGYIIIVTVVAVTELNMFRYSHPSPTIAAWTIIYFAFDLAICMMANLGVTNNLKFYVGRYRPDFLNRCELPDTYAIGTPLNAAVDCTTTNLKELHEGHLSFPSGHTSFAFCQGMYMAVYLLWCFYIRPQPPHHLRRIQARSRFAFEVIESINAFVIFIGPLAACWVGASRIVDYKHNASDANGGAIIGMFCATLTFVRGIGVYRRIKPVVIAMSGDGPVQSIESDSIEPTRETYGKTSTI